MDISTERHFRQASAPQTGDDARPDWAGLRARFVAALATREALWTIAAQADDSGSFDPASARQMDAYGHGLSPVNPVALSHGKSREGNHGDTAGTMLTGGRG